MAKATSNKTGLAKQVTKQQFVELSANTSPDDQTAMQALFEAAKNVDTDELTQVAGNDYMELEEGNTYIFICKGIVKGALPSKDPRKNGDLVDAVSLIKEDLTETINADVVMVSTVRRQGEAGKTYPCMIKVFVKGMKKSQSGEYKDLDMWFF